MILREWLVKRLSVGLTLAILAMSVVMAACRSASVSGPPSPSKPSAVPSIKLPPGMSQAFEIIDTKAATALDASVRRHQHACVLKKGFTAEALPVGARFGGLIQSPARFGYMTENEARRVGLHLGPIAAEPDVASSDRPGLTDAQTQCWSDAVALLGPRFDEVQSEATQLENDLAEAFYAQIRTAQYDALSQEMHCVAESGWKPVLPDKLGDPDISPQDLFGVQVAASSTNGATGKEAYVPLPREVDLALAMLHCRLKLGLPDKLMVVAKRVELQLVAKYEQRIRQVNTDVEEMARKAAKVLG